MTDIQNDRPLDEATENTVVTESTLPEPTESDGAAKEVKNTEPIEVVGVRFRQVGKVYYFAPGKMRLTMDTPVIVETARGVEIGTTATPNIKVRTCDVVPPLRPVIRVATEDDIRRYEANREKEKEAFDICRKKIEDHGLEMNLIDAEYTFDNSKLLFYFTSEKRVDFRELVKDLASVFRTRIELRQIGIRDEAKMKGGIGLCGRPFCCGTFLNDFVQVSIKMAKEQNFSLNSAKISGACGRLMCCLRYEHETYEEEIKKTPAVGYLVKTEAGEGVVVESNPLAGTVKVRFDEKPEQPRQFAREDVTVLGKASKRGAPQQKPNTPAQPTSGEAPANTGNADTPSVSEPTPDAKKNDRQNNNRHRDRRNRDRRPRNGNGNDNKQESGDRTSAGASDGESSNG